MIKNNTVWASFGLSETDSELVVHFVSVRIPDLVKPDGHIVVVLVLGLEPELLVKRHHLVPARQAQLVHLHLPRQVLADGDEQLPQLPAPERVADDDVLEHAATGAGTEKLLLDDERRGGDDAVRRGVLDDVDVVGVGAAAHALERPEEEGVVDVAGDGQLPDEGGVAAAEVGGLERAEDEGLVARGRAVVSQRVAAIHKRDQNRW